jgi:hypothetical protein
VISRDCRKPVEINGNLKIHVAVKTHEIVSAGLLVRHRGQYCWSVSNVERGSRTQVKMLGNVVNYSCQILDRRLLYACINCRYLQRPCLRWLTSTGLRPHSVTLEMGSKHRSPLLTEFVLTPIHDWCSPIDMVVLPEACALSPSGSTCGAM